MGRSTNKPSREDLRKVQDILQRLESYTPGSAADVELALAQLLADHREEVITTIKGYSMRNIPPSEWSVFKAYRQMFAEAIENLGKPKVTMKELKKR